MTAALGVLLACGSEPVTDRSEAALTASEPNRAMLIVRNAAEKAPSLGAVRIDDVRRKNPLAAVGLAHNAAVREFFRALSHEDKGRPCDAATRAVAAARRAVGADSSRYFGKDAEVLGYQQHDALSCRRPSAFRRTGASSASSGVASGPYQPYLDAIELLEQTRPSTTSFLAQVQAIVDDASSNLTGVDLEIVQAVASVAIESHDLWITNNEIVAIADSMEAVYGGCVTLADDPPTCFYESQHRDHEASPPLLFRYAALQTQSCYATWMSPWKVWKYDLGGAAGGAVVGSLAGPGGATIGAAGGALTMSIGEAVVQVIDYLTCKLS